MKYLSSKMKSKAKKIIVLRKILGGIYSNTTPKQLSMWIKCVEEGEYCYREKSEIYNYNIKCERKQYFRAFITCKLCKLINGKDSDKWESKKIS